MTHEYSHSFTAWLLGWMRDPLALDYGKATVGNILFLGDVSDNVDYDAIFASGHGGQASIIALAGVVVGNAALYALLGFLSKRRSIASDPIRLSMTYWLALMCVGNVWSYVPIRALTTHADIALSARGLGISPWLQFPFLFIPAAYIVVHFFTRFCARAFPVIAGDSGPRAALLTSVTAYWFCIFFVGDAAGGDYGLISEVMALTSKYLLFPLCSLWLWRRYADRTGGTIE
jgi:hypothetical protein